MQDGETKKEEITYYNSDSRPIFSQNGTVMMRVTFFGKSPSVNTPSQELLTYPRTQRKRLLQPGAGRPLTLHGFLWPAGDFYSDRRPASPVLCLGPLAKFVRPKAFLWEDAGLSSCSLAMIKVRLVPKTLSFYSLILAFSNQMATLYFQL